MIIFLVNQYYIYERTGQFYLLCAVVLSDLLHDWWPPVSMLFLIPDPPPVPPAEVVPQLGHPPEGGEETGHAVVNHLGHRDEGEAHAEAQQTAW